MKCLLALSAMVGAASARYVPTVELGTNFDKSTKMYRHTAPEVTVIENDYIVMVDPGADVTSVVSSLGQKEFGMLSNVRHVYGDWEGAGFKGFSLHNVTEKAIIDFAVHMKEVVLVEQDQVAQAYASPQEDLDTWGLDRIDQLDLPLDDLYVYPDSAGAGVDTYIIDTGIRDTHEDLVSNADRVSAQIFNAVGDGRDEDCNGHGTHVAGTTAGTLYGVAKKANMYGIKVLGCSGSGSFAGVVDGVDYVNSQSSDKTKIANMSLGGGGSPCLDEAVNAATDVLHVVAAGNSNANSCNYSPARAGFAYAVMASDENDLKASFSNTGGCSNIWAPGVNIKAPWHLGDDNYNTISGTSMAAPHVAGVAATILADSPSLSAIELAAYLSGMAGSDKVPSAVLDGTPNLMLYNNRDDELPGQPPLPPPPTPAPCLCDNTCIWAFDVDCDDGGPGFNYSLCVLGSDCADCGNSYREEFSPGVECEEL